jgi:hypothetical protein
MTQRQRVLKMLTDAGPKGVSSRTFIGSYLPRAAARIQELKDEGVPITTEREGKYVRYFVGVGAGCPSACDAGESQAASVDSGEGFTGGRERAEVASGAIARPVPSMFDADVEWA